MRWSHIPARITKCLLFIYSFIVLRANRGNFRGRGEEDYFSLFDGHGGSDASLFACENLHFQVSSAVPKLFAFVFAFSSSFALFDERRLNVRSSSSFLQIWKHMNQKRIADNADPANNTEDIKKILTAAFLGSRSISSLPPGVPRPLLMWCGGHDISQKHTIS